MADRGGKFDAGREGFAMQWWRGVARVRQKRQDGHWRTEESVVVSRDRALPVRRRRSYAGIASLSTLRLHSRGWSPPDLDLSVVSLVRL